MKRFLDFVEQEEPVIADTMLRAIIFNGSLKADQDNSNTQKVINLVEKEFEQYNVEVETIYLRDYRIAPGVDFDTGDSWDEAKVFFDKVEGADIVILASPIWWGIHSSLIQALMERLGAYDDKYIKTGKSDLYTKTFGSIITASNDGFQHAGGIFKVFASGLGFTIPPESTVTWGTILNHSKSSTDPSKNPETVSSIKNFCRNQYLWSDMLRETNLGSYAKNLDPGKVGILSNDKLKK
jgi:multimeric flavodoxin WrbA